MTKNRSVTAIALPLVVTGIVLAVLWRARPADGPLARDAATTPPGPRGSDGGANGDGTPGVPAADGELILYSSADDEYLRLVLDRFGARTGVKVRAVGDTEATKTFGLVQRLIAEKDSPRADVWWSSEPMSSIELAGAGVLAPMDPAPKLDDATPWPSDLRDREGRWFAFARRARALAYSSSRVKESDAPTRLRDLLDPRWRGRVGLARPQFGTTRTHLAALVALAGESKVETWLAALRDHGVRLYDGNAAVVRAIANAEIDVGLTDSDDVFAGRRNNWPIGLRYEGRDPDPGSIDGLPSFGTIMLPNTVGLVRKPGGPTGRARALAEFLLSAEVETMLAESDSRNVPVRPELARAQAARDPSTFVPEPAVIDLGAVSRAAPDAAAIADRVLK